MIFLSFLILLFCLSTIFLGSELLKKFKYIQAFIGHSDQMIVWHYDGKEKPGMYTIVLDGNQHFAVLLGFKLKILTYSGIDHYGCISSNSQNKAIFSTYLGRKSVDFYFLSNHTIKDCPLHVTCVKTTSNIIPTHIFKPHWWQKIGFYA